MRTRAPKGRTPYHYPLYKQHRISAIRALAVSPQRRHMGLYIRCRSRNLTGLDVRAFCRILLRHLRGPVVMLWDRGGIHRRREVKRYLQDHPRFQSELFPAYAPELNPAEHIGTQADRALANTASKSLLELGTLLRRSIRRVKGSQRLLWSCIEASELPWRRCIHSVVRCTRQSP